MKKCNCDQCEGYHEGYCVMDTIYEGFNPEECKAKSNADLIDGCIQCEERPADAEFPYGEYCKECAKDVHDEVLDFIAKHKDNDTKERVE